MGKRDLLAAAHEIRLDPKLPLHSIARLAKPGAAFDRDSHVRIRHHKIPKPEVFRKEKSRELRKLRKAQLWKTGTRDEQVEQMAQWFPDLPPGGSTKGLSNPYVEQFSDPTFLMRGGAGCGNRDSENFPGKLYRERAAKYSYDYANVAIRTTPNAPTALRVMSCPESDLGTLAKLPGEIRNSVYRLVLLEDDKNASALITLQPNTCALGACLHNKATHCTPGIINTCRQIRHEAAPIFFSENAGIVFDDGMVMQGCVSNWLRTIGGFVNQIRKFTFQMLRPLHNEDKFVQWATYSISINVAKVMADSEPIMQAFTDTVLQYSEYGRFKLQQSVANTLAFNPLRDEICTCPLRVWVRQMDVQWQLYEAPDFSKTIIGMSEKQFGPGPVPAPAKKSLLESLTGFVQEDDFTDFVWRLRKNKLPQPSLKVCRTCKEVKFDA